jgi:hypothetical protein
MKFLINRAPSWRRPQFHFWVKYVLRTIYRPGPFQRAQICEDRSLETGELSGQRNCLKVKNNNKAYILISLRKTLNRKLCKVNVKSKPLPILSRAGAGPLPLSLSLPLLLPLPLNAKFVLHLQPRP